MTTPSVPTRSRPDRILGIAVGSVLVVIALVVATLVGRPSDTSGTSSLSADGTQTVAVELANMRITPAIIPVASGTKLILNVTNTDANTHDLHIDGGPQTPFLTQGQHATLDLGVVTKSAQGWCTLPGHKAAGMVTSIIVTGAGTTDRGTPTMPPMSGMPSSGGRSAAIDFSAQPAPSFKPFNPRLAPAAGAKEHRVTFTVHDTLTEVAPGVKQTLWTYNGTAPGPILRGHVGDLFTVTIVNHGTMDHSIDFHAGSTSPDESMRAVAPGKSLVYQFTATYSGAWLYHCSTMPMSLHIANGMFGAVIIDPPDLAPVNQEFILVQSELYLGAQSEIADDTKVNAGTPDATVFNGYVNQYEHAPIRVKAGERIRVWVVDAGPQFGTSFHVVGTQFDTVFKEGAYSLRAGNAEAGAAQSLDLAPAQGGFVEFTLATAGHYPFLDHAMVTGEHGAHGVFVAH